MLGAIVVAVVVVLRCLGTWSLWRRHFR